MRVYIAGPMSSSGVLERNVAKGINAADRVLQMGHTPFIPHLNVLWAMVSHIDHGFATWIKWNLEWLSSCHALLRLPGVSKGVEIEVVARAKELGIPVFTDENELETYLKEHEDSPEKLLEMQMAQRAYEHKQSLKGE